MTIKMKMKDGKSYEFRVTYQCPAYIFAECPSNPEMRGFFTSNYIKENQVI